MGEEVVRLSVYKKLKVGYIERRVKLRIQKPGCVGAECLSLNRACRVNAGGPSIA